MQPRIVRPADASHSDYLPSSPSFGPDTRIIPKKPGWEETTWSRFKTGDRRNLRPNWATSIVAA
jgi:hypothetical protein